MYSVELDVKSVESLCSGSTLEGSYTDDDEADCWDLTLPKCGLFL